MSQKKLTFDRELRLLNLLEQQLLRCQNKRRGAKKNFHIMKVFELRFPTYVSPKAAAFALEHLPNLVHRSLTLGTASKFCPDVSSCQKLTLLLAITNEDRHLLKVSYLSIYLRFMDLDAKVAERYSDFYTQGVDWNDILESLRIPANLESFSKLIEIGMSEVKTLMLKQSTSLFLVFRDLAITAIHKKNIPAYLKLKMELLIFARNHYSEILITPLSKPGRYQYLNKINQNPDVVFDP